METVFGFNISVKPQLYNKDVESCFEMNKAKNYPLPISLQTDENPTMYWIHGENICPEMQAAIQMAKNEFTHLWPDIVSDLSVAELIFQIMAQQKTIQDLTEEKARLKEEIFSLESRLQDMVPKPQISISNEPMSPVNEVSMCTVCDETMTPTNCYKPVPGVNTILACGEKTRVDEDQSTAVTTKVCQGIDQLAHMFCCNESVQRSPAYGNEAFPMRDLPPMEAADPAPVPKPPVSIYQRNDENSSRPCRVQLLKNEPLLPRFGQNDILPPEIPLGNRPGGLKLRKEEFEQPPGLQIFKDPEGLACGEGVDVKRQRHPLRTLKPRSSPTKQQPLEHLGEENLAPRCFPPLHENFSQLDLTGSRIDLVPCCASTAVFSVSPSPVAPISGGIGSISSPTIEPKLKMQQERQLQPDHQEFKPDDNDMEMENLPQSSDRPNSPLSAAFNQFVHSPDENGRLRIDATKFMDVFLTRKSKNPTGASDSKWLPMF